MQSIKAVVVALGIVLVLGIGALLGVVVERFAGPGHGGADPAAALPSRTGPSPPLAAGFGQLSLDRPEGTRVRAMATVGHLVVVQLGADTGSGGDELVVIDPARGTVVGTIRLSARP